MAIKFDFFGDELMVLQITTSSNSLVSHMRVSLKTSDRWSPVTKGANRNSA